MTAALSSNLCEKCVNVDLLKAKEKQELIQHHDNYVALESAALAGCGLCFVLWQVLTTEQSRKCKQSAEEAKAALLLGNGPALWISVSDTGGHLTWKDEQGVVKNGRFRNPTFCLYRGSGFVHWPGDPLLRRRLVSEYPDLALGKEWITSCASLHRGCAPLANRELPTRLIDVGTGTANHTLKLVETSGASGQYITLSHCWGKSRYTVTTRANYAAHLRSLTYEELPLTFQDAVKITAMLGFQYLWIDSLCIIQGDKDDWQQQGARMAQIYQNSALTIAGPASASAYDGLIHRRPMRPSCQLPIRDSSKSIVGTIVIGLDQDVTPHEAESNSPLAERAWVLQERLLSPRILYFGSKQLYFECNASARFEAFHNGSSNVDLSHEKDHDTNTNGNRLVAKAIFDLLQQRAVQYSPSYWWKIIVETYASCKLTEGQDKLPALSGIAKRFSQLTNDEYLAGLWRSDTRFGLLWHADFQSPTGGQPRSLRPAKYAAPSWSWASSNYAVSFNPEIEDCGGIYGPHPAGYLGHPFEVVAASVTSDSADEYGEVTSGTLVLQAPLKRSVIQRNGPEYRNRQDLSCFLCRSSQDETPIAQFLPDSGDWLTADAGYRQEVYCLFVASSKFFRFLALALELVRLSGGEKVFRRIGKLIQPSDHPIQPRGFDLLDNTGNWFSAALVEQVIIV